MREIMGLAALSNFPLRYATKERRLRRETVGFLLFVGAARPERRRAPPLFVRKLGLGVFAGGRGGGALRRHAAGWKRLGFNRCSRLAQGERFGDRARLARQ